MEHPGSIQNRRGRTCSKVSGKKIYGELPYAKGLIGITSKNDCVHYRKVYLVRVDEVCFIEFSNECGHDCRGSSPYRAKSSYR